MIQEITKERVLQMSEQEERLFDNIKKAYYNSDLKAKSLNPEDGCLEEAFKGIDTAKTLRRSLLGLDITHKQNGKKFVEFLGLKIPGARPEAEKYHLVDPVTKKEYNLNLGELIYNIRCKIHENENLNISEGARYFVLLDWRIKSIDWHHRFYEDKCIISAFGLWNRLREILSEMIMHIESCKSWDKTGLYTVNIRPPLNSLRHKKAEQNACSNSYPLRG